MFTYWWNFLTTNMKSSSLCVARFRQTSGCPVSWCLSDCQKRTFKKLLPLAWKEFPDVSPNMKYGKSKGSSNINSRLEKFTSTYPRLKIFKPSFFVSICHVFFLGGGYVRNHQKSRNTNFLMSLICALSGHHGCGSGWYGSMSWTWYAWHGNLVVFQPHGSPWSPWSLGVVDPTLNGMGCITLVNIPTSIGIDDHTLWVSKPSFDPWQNIYSTNRSILGFPTILFLPRSFMILESKIVGHLSLWDLTFFV